MLVIQHPGTPVWRRRRDVVSVVLPDGVGVVYGVPAFRELNGASLGLGEYESFKKATLDPYVAMRSAYYESRADAVKKARARNDARKTASTITPVQSRAPAS
jgi:ABC-type transporter lipoprotein component MlaA